jgi:hypothetical protein
VLQEARRICRHVRATFFGMGARPACGHGCALRYCPVDSGASLWPLTADRLLFFACGTSSDRLDFADLFGGKKVVMR